MLPHPCFVYKDPFQLLPLVRTYVEPGIDYWIDVVTDQSRMRLTNILTGEYVIYGDLGKHAQPEYDVGVDESLCMNMPDGVLRVCTSNDPLIFQTIDIPADLTYRGISNNWCIFVIEDMRGNLSYDFARFHAATKADIRALQHTAVRAAPAHNRRLTVM